MCVCTCVRTRRDKTDGIMLLHLSVWNIVVDRVLKFIGVSHSGNAESHRFSSSSEHDDGDATWPDSSVSQTNES